MPTQVFYPYVIYRCVVGSRAYGLEEPDSDTDRRGFYLPPADLHWSLHGVPEQLENDATQECYWELQKFITLALKANPTILECLYTPIREDVTPLAQELLDKRAIFLSKRVHQTYNGYVQSQFRKMQNKREKQGAFHWKHAMHLIRLLVGGVELLKTGHLTVTVHQNREALLAIRRGEWTWEAVNEWRLALHQELDAAYAITKLPDEPDYEQANTFLIKARRHAI